MGSQRSEGRSGRIDRLAQMRNQLRERDNMATERENKLIERLHERMNQAASRPDLTREQRVQIINNFTRQIELLVENRANREAEAAEKEAMINQMILDESGRVEERERAEENRYEDEEEAEKRRERESIANMTQMAINSDILHSLKRTRHSLAAEAGHLARAMDSAAANMSKVGVVPRGLPGDPNAEFDVIISRNPIRGGDNWTSNQYNKLREGIARTDAAILSRISSMYHDSLKEQEAYLAGHEEDNRDESYDEQA